MEFKSIFILHGKSIPGKANLSNLLLSKFRKSQCPAWSWRTMEQERRRRPRFQIRQPISLEVPHDSLTDVLPGTMENVSLVGVLVTTETQIPEGTRVDLALMLVPPSTPPSPLRLLNAGRVVRVETRPDGNASIAIECDRAFEFVTAICAN